MITRMFNYYVKAMHILNAKIRFSGAKKLGKRVSACKNLQLRNTKYMEIGDKCYFGPNCRIEAWDQYKTTRFTPHIVIGNDVRINSTCHIGAINKITIGDECLLGSHVMIIDHSHGKSTIDEMKIHPSERELYSKGEIEIGKHVWLCENVVVLPNVHIGDGCIIGANSVVTSDIPAYSVAAGSPARVVKKMV